MAQSNAILRVGITGDTELIHDTAIIEDGATLGDSVAVWAYTQIRTGATIGANTIIGSHSYIDSDVTIGERCKIQSGVRLFHGANVEDGVFLGPGCIVTNDRNPRAVNPDGTIKTAAEWVVTPTRIGTGASLGAGSIIVAGAHIGSFALVGAGTTVTRPVAPHAIVVGNPSSQIGWVCHCGRRLEEQPREGWRCHACDKIVRIPSE